MKQVIFVGQAQVRELTKENLASMGVEQKKTDLFTFKKGEPQEVSNAVADVLVRSGEFMIYEPSEQSVVDTEGDEGDEGGADPGAGPAPDASLSDEGTGSETPEEKADA